MFHFGTREPSPCLHPHLISQFRHKIPLTSMSFLPFPSYIDSERVVQKYDD